MSAARQDQHRRLAEVAEIQFARVAADGRFGKAGNFGVGNLFVHAQFRQDVMKSAAEHDGERRAQRRNFLSRAAAALASNWLGIAC